jgi:hypothetical protein
MRQAVLAAVLFALVLSACAGSSEDVAEAVSGLSQSATLVFRADFSQQVQGTLLAGGVAQLDYDVARLTGCRGERYGQPAWNITAHYRIAGGEVRSVYVAGHAAAPDEIGVPLTLDRPGLLEVWFENTSSFGCQAWDSALGANYRFDVLSAESAALVRFGSDGSFSITGAPRQGTRLDIQYDITRLPTCRDTKYGLPAWSILARYRWPSGRTGYVPVTSGVASLDLTESGELELWFENQGYFGCRAYDSRYGQNYRIHVEADARAPGWLGNAAYVIDRMTCDGPCDQSRHSLDESFTDGTWARQRAAIRALYFDVWKEGVTDFDNPELWRELDVQVHYRARSDGPFQTRPVDFFRRVGNDARYQLLMDQIDPLSGPYRREDKSQCPDADLVSSSDGATVATVVEFYFTVNGVTLRRRDDVNFRGTFEDYRYDFEVCVQ